DVSSAHTNGRKYHWIINGDETVTDSPSLVVSNIMTWGTIFQLQGFVEDRSGRPSDMQSLTVFYGGNTGLANALYGTLVAQGAPTNTGVDLRYFNSFEGQADLGANQQVEVAFV